MKRRSFITTMTSAGLGLALAPIPIACTRKLDTEILILGGGISGLYLAYLLEKAGKEYILLEGSERLGGRMFIREDMNREVGGRGIGDNYKEITALINALNIAMIDITNYSNEHSAIYVNGQLHPKWPEAKSNPKMLEFSALASAPQLSSLEGWYQTPDLDETYSSLLKRLGSTEKELALINISANYNDIRETSAINAYHSMAFRKFNGSKRILNFKEGTKSFIDAIVNTLSAKPHTNKLVTAIADEKYEVIVTCKDGSTYKARKVVSTLPFTTLRDVKTDISFHEKQKKAIAQIPYTLITQIHLQHKEAFWEEDNTPLSMWTDTPLERIMNVSSNPDEKAIVCWVNGKGAHFFDRMSDAEIAHYTLKKFSEIRPASEGKLEYLGVHSWGNYPFNKGAYIEFDVGQASWFQDMIRPAGNVHFAGAHTARSSRGIEGAAESARRVYNELVTA